MTGQRADEFLTLLEAVQRMEIPLWLRHVVVPGLTDGNEHLEGLKDYIGTLKHVERVELLPYHVLGVHKYEALNIPYPLKGVEPMDSQKLLDWQILMNHH